MQFEYLLGLEESPPGYTTVRRDAIRGVVMREEGMILVLRTNKGDYKLPGGGLEAGETHFEALRRETMEETGYSICDRITNIGLITERRPDFYVEGTIFMMVSHYYLCRVEPEVGERCLEPYEREAEFTAEFVQASEAYANNKKLVEVTPQLTQWLQRETLALRTIADRLAELREAVCQQRLL